MFNIKRQSQLLQQKCGPYRANITKRLPRSYRNGQKVFGGPWAKKDANMRKEMAEEQE